jgi:hypothetical protein
MVSGGTERLPSLSSVSLGCIAIVSGAVDGGDSVVSTKLWVGFDAPAAEERHAGLLDRMRMIMVSSAASSRPRLQRVGVIELG